MSDAGDVKLFQTENGGDISIIDGVIAMNGGLESSAYLALFGGSDWWGNRAEVSERQYISRTGKLLQSLPLTSSNLLEIEDAVASDLSFFTELKIASSVEIVVSIPALNTVSIAITITADGKETDFTFTENWKALIIEDLNSGGQIGVVPPPILSYAEETLLDPTLVAYWRFGESSGVVAVDELGNTNGTYVGSPTLGVSGLIIGDTDTAVNFADNTRWMVADGPALAVANEYTLEAWVIFDVINPPGPTDNNQTIFNKRFNGEASTTEFVLDVAFGGNFRLLGAVGWVISTTQLVAGVKYYVVGTRLNDVGSIYINGVLDVSGPLPTAFVGIQPLGVGVASDFGTPLASVRGTIDEPALYNTAFDLEKVQTRYNKGLNL
jgi:Concanavalin A-like lectin/glucanases superfamily